MAWKWCLQLPIVECNIQIFLTFTFLSLTDRIVACLIRFNQRRCFDWSSLRLTMFHTRLKQKMEWNALPCAKLFHTNCSKPNFPSPHNFTLLVKYQIIWASQAKWLTLLPQTTSAIYRELGVTTTGNTCQASYSWQTSWQESNYDRNKSSCCGFQIVAALHFLYALKPSFFIWCYLTQPTPRKFQDGQ